MTKLRPFYYYNENLHRRIHAPEMNKKAYLDMHYRIEHYIAEYTKAKKETDNISVAKGFQDEVQKLLDADKSSELWSRVKCGKGCSFCCHYHIDITDDEAELLVAHAKEKGIVIDRERLEKQKDTTVETWRNVKYADKRCVFLSDAGECRAYEVRPISCRNLHVITEPKNCSIEDGTETVGGFSDVDADILHTATINATRSANMANLLLEKMQ